ncbi:uncharacterized protein LOC124280880 [Haliotis rubra]|uniref:uncharacterized protein LOC124280880 n=1 Tax=Haliotis rubra TaxID=36100 RepID=UPI001EE581A4|nr:uncharacterized protein LOC124280880 [Haliotis rubra]XP_046572827.1 uncharacterized protein LOC124280880 [Haliotis rubra]
MVRKKDLGKVFFIYLCLFSVCPAHPCGENPLRGFMSLSRLTGKNVNHLLGILRSANTDLYGRLERNWQLYANCVGMVDTGYFKRSGSPALSDRASNQMTRTLPVQALSLHDLIYYDRSNADDDSLL